MHSQASLGGRDQLASRAHSPNRSRPPATFALAQVTGQRLACDVSHYLWVNAPATQPPSPLRQAVCRFFAHRPAEGVALIAETGLLEFGGNKRAISLGDIVAPLVCSAQLGAGVLHSDRLRLVQFGNCSRM